MNNFSKLGLSQSIIEVLDQLGFDTPTPVQEKAIPMLLQNDPTDFIGLAQTGTGKTAAFGLPLIDLIDLDDPTTQAIVMAPTRELGQQTAQQLVSFAKNNRALNIEVVYGGAAIMGQIMALKRPTQIIVATPGRLIDLIKRKAVNLENVKYVVLDEADEMLNMGFKEDIDEILSYTQENRVTWLFSATMPKEIRRIVSKYMDNPLEVAVNTEQKSNVDITHKYVITKAANKIPSLKRFLDIQPDMRGIMFCRTKRETQEIADELGQMGYGVEALHGDLSQAQRDAVMKRFKTRSMQLLIATDVAARGIDVNDLTHVLHHSIPDQLESYTHRSGRTGRAGNKGTSLVFINPRESRKITELERRIKVKFERIEVPTLEEMKSSRINSWANLIINTKVDDQADNILKTVSERFSDLSKEDLLKRLITTQLDHIMTPDEDVNLNETHGGSPANRDKSGFNRYFINVGEIDGMTNADIIHFLSDVSGVDRKFFGDLSLQKNCSYFDVDSTKDKGFGESFEGTEIQGRSIRVNRDEDGRPRKRRSDSFNKGGSYGGGSSYGGGGRGKRSDRDKRPDRDKGRPKRRRRL
ncbi:DEAD/DEAH box helicase [Roseivirga seohaensis]|uniref:DEAD/DEAH box helicase n=1 Tax=Roseivirga seohaensis TaxID=1914963 RepID=UPI003BAC4EEF